MIMIKLSISLQLLIIVFSCNAQKGNEAILKEEFILELQKKHVHSSSILELPNGDLLAVWFSIAGNGGERTAEDVKLNGARLQKGKTEWSKPFLMAETALFPDGNPVLFLNKSKKLFLVWYVLQAEVWNAAIMKIRTSVDYSNVGPPIWEWQDNIFLKLDDHFTAEVKNKLSWDKIPLPPEYEIKKEEIVEYDQKIIELSKDKITRSIGWMTRLQPIILFNSPHKGRILLPLCSESYRFSLISISDDDGETWTPSLPIVGRGNIQPALLEKKNGDIIAFMRDMGRTVFSIHKSISRDGGKSWSHAEYIDIKNPDSSIEAKVLKDGRWVLVCNDMANEKVLGGCCDGRQRLSLFISDDEGESWGRKLIIEDDTNKPEEDRGRYHYPSLIQTGDGMLHLSFTFNTRYSPYLGEKSNAIKYVVIDPAKIE